MKKLQLEKAWFDEFINQYSATNNNPLRIGQAFYNHFSLHKMIDQRYFRNLYELDGNAAIAHIYELFDIQ